MPLYETDPAWADVTPIELDDGGPSPLVAIAYSDDYAEAMSYLRAVMAADEMSERALALTEDLIQMNPAHYTVWLYRARILTAISADLSAELTWLNSIALRHLKNYQIWHHRQTLVDRLGSADGEQAFLRSMLDQDAKNYHVWSYRQWLVRRFALWADDSGELASIEELLNEDVLNNSAWNHRWFLVFGREGQEEGYKVLDETVERELAFAKAAVRKEPQNQSPWNYIRGLLRQTKRPLAEMKDFASEFAALDRPDEVRSSHALDLLADIFADEESNAGQAKVALAMLATKFDPIRASYWQYRKSLLPSKEAPAA
ncbi:farnesyltransferas-like protein [Lineolata rhizophorae]|uniref:Protein farnesyltransferase/geranylgeranyltransferase type-1 subunit alpha n=1 Tax=Lineolata rhizophorae TaxID=578093 RepID=A0A6A6NTS2_9PEZI|nr:farnesyltransferas-like protein [Lineolata rhizophorae]